MNHRLYVHRELVTTASRWAAASLLLAALGWRPAAATEPAPDLILFNGHIFTSDRGHLHAEALAIRGERIAAVGDNAAIRSLADAHTRQIDLHGRTVVPGLNDAHAHMTIEPQNEVPIETSGYNPAWPELKQAIVKAAATPSGGILWGVIGTTVFYDPAIDRAALDAVAPHRPVFLATFDGHAAILNSEALRRFGIGEDVVDPLGGRYERDAAGRLTGVIREYARFELGERVAQRTTDADGVAGFKDFINAALRYGVTSVQDMPVAGDIDRNARLLGQVPTTIRVRLTRMNRTTANGPDYRANATPPAGLPSLVTVSGTKWVLDGVNYEGGLTPRPVGRSSPGAGPYSFAGLPHDFSPTIIEAMLRDALRHGYQLQFHVFGTLAAKEVLDAMDRTGGARVWANRRVRFEHGNGLTPDLVARVKRLGVIVSQQGSHLDLLGIDAGLGPDFLARMRADRAEPLRSLVTAGIPLALGSDGPLNPWLGVLGATTDPDRPEEALTREEAIIAYTAGSAYAEFAETEKGTLSPGKLADIAVLSQDVFTVSPPDLLKTRSVLTIVGGHIVYTEANAGF